MGYLILLVGLMVLCAAGASLLFMTPRQQGITVSVGLGVLDLLAAVLLGAVYASGMDSPQFPESTLRFILAWCIAEGLLQLGLAAGISANLPVCALVGAVFHSIGVVMQGVTDPKSPGMLIRIILAAILWRAYLHIRAEQADMVETERRRQQIERQRATFRAVVAPTSHAAPEPARPSQRLAFVPTTTSAPAASGEAAPQPAGKLIGRRTPRHAPPAGA